MTFFNIPRLAHFCGMECKALFNHIDFTVWINTYILAVKPVNADNIEVSTEEGLALSKEHDLPFYEFNLADGQCMQECLHNVTMESLPAILYKPQEKPKQKKKSKCTIN